MSDDRPTRSDATEMSGEDILESGVSTDRNKESKESSRRRTGFRSGKAQEFFSDDPEHESSAEKERASEQPAEDDSSPDSTSGTAKDSQEPDSSSGSSTGQRSRGRGDSSKAAPEHYLEEEAAGKYQKVFDLQDADRTLREVARMPARVRQSNKTTLVLSHDDADMLNDIKRELRRCGMDSNTVTTSTLVAVALRNYRSLLDTDPRHTRPSLLEADGED